MRMEVFCSVHFKQSVLRQATEKDVFKGLKKSPDSYVVIPDITSSVYSSNNQSVLLAKNVVSIIKLNADVKLMSKQQIDAQLYPQYLLLYFLAEYLHFEAPFDEQNTYMIMELLSVTENGQRSISDLDRLFNLLAEKESNEGKHVALVHYRKFKAESSGRDKSIALELREKLRPYFSTEDDLFEAVNSSSIKKTAKIHLTLLLHTFCAANDRVIIRKHGPLSVGKIGNCFYRIIRWRRYRHAFSLLVEILRSMQKERKRETAIRDVIRRLDEVQETLGPKCEASITIMDVVGKLDAMPESTPGRALLLKATKFFSEFK